MIFDCGHNGCDICGVRSCDGTPVDPVPSWRNRHEAEFHLCESCHVMAIKSIVQLASRLACQPGAMDTTKRCGGERL